MTRRPSPVPTYASEPVPKLRNRVSTHLINRRQQSPVTNPDARYFGAGRRLLVGRWPVTEIEAGQMNLFGGPKGGQGSWRQNFWIYLFGVLKGDADTLNGTLVPLPHRTRGLLDRYAPSIRRLRPGIVPVQLRPQLGPKKRKAAIDLLQHK